MPVAQLLSAAAVVVAMGGIFALMLGGMRRNGYAARTIRGLGSYAMPEEGGRLAGGVVATAALASLLDMSTLDGTPVAVTGALVGLSAALLPNRPALEIVFGVCGVLGIAGTSWGFITDSECSGIGLQTRIAMISVLSLTALLGALFAILRGRLRPVAPLAAFAILEILIFLSTPLGVPLILDGGVHTLVPFAVAGLMGFFGALMPGIVIGLGAAGVALTTVAVGAEYGTMCSAAPQTAPLLTLIAFGVTYVVARKIVTRGR